MGYTVPMTQNEALTILKTGANVFLTGEPGSGKTYAVNQYVEYLRSCGVEPAITASTGIAATHIGGMTIHSWSGIGINPRVNERDLDFLSQKEKLVKRLSETRVLIIDEVSMLSADVLSSVELVLRTLRHSDEPFGGLQVILVGDFFQLPPVEKRGHRGSDDLFEGAVDARTPFAFHSPVWEQLRPLVCYLSEQYRQEDEQFLSVLSALRRGEVDEDIVACLHGRCVEPEEGAVATKLFPHNANVDVINDGELGKLESASRVYEMRSRGSRARIEGLKRNCLSPEVLTLKIGAKVMFTKNSPDGKYVNGTLGEVADFSPTNGQPIVRLPSGRTLEAEPVEWAIEDGGKMLASITQLPLRLAWAITVHKSQGMSLDAAVIDLSRAFEYGQGYVALSRVRTLKGLYLLGFNRRALEVHPDVEEVDGRFRAQSDEAGGAFAGLDEHELKEMQENFIRAIGGEIGAGRKVKGKKIKVSTYDATKELVRKGLSIAEMAKERGMTEGTIIGHLEKLTADGALDAERDLAHLKPETERFLKMHAAFEKVYAREQKMPLAPARTLTGNRFTYDELRLARIFVSTADA
jgi:hypothetical protein